MYTDIRSQLDAYLEIGIALMDLDNLVIEYENDLFKKWIPNLDHSRSISDRLTNLNIERLNKRLARGRNYSMELEVDNELRKKSLKITFSLIPEYEGKIALIHVMDNSRNKELEYMMDSYAKISEKRKKQLERANDKITRQNIRMKNELEIAKQVQLGMLPFNFDANNSNIEFAALLKPAKEVGGDFFDIFYIDDENLCICLGDVSDKGAGSALFMAATKTLIKSHSMNANSTAEVAGKVNNELAVNNSHCMFTTLFIGIINLISGDLLYSNCGHCYPILLNDDCSMNKLTELNGPAIGIVENHRYTEQRIQLSKNQTVLLYSDGVTESSNRDGILYGTDRLQTVISDPVIIAEPQLTINAIFDSVIEYEKGTEQSDDITLLAVKYLA